MKQKVPIQKLIYRFLPKFLQTQMYFPRELKSNKQEVLQNSDATLQNSKSHSKPEQMPRSMSPVLVFYVLCLLTACFIVGIVIGSSALLLIIVGVAVFAFKRIICFCIPVRNDKEH